MDITAFIRELLFGHDCVIVPGFGGFICNYTPARIDRTSGAFYPPVKKISFNRNITHNDGLLAGRISESAKMNYVDARNLVEDFVNNTRTKLSKGDKVVFENIGSFLNDKEGNLQFEPDSSANYHLDSYGLASFQLSPLEHYDVREKIVKFREKDPVRQASLRRNLWRAAVIIPLVAALVAVPLSTDIFKSKVQRTSLNPLADIEFENNKQSVDREKANDSLLTVNIQTPSEKPVITETAAVTLSEKPSELSVEYCLIAGSFKSRENASGLIKKLEAEGLHPELLEGPNGFVRVSASRISGLSGAMRMADSLNSKFPGIWAVRVK